MKVIGLVLCHYLDEAASVKRHFILDATSCQITIAESLLLSMQIRFRVKIKQNLWKSGNIGSEQQIWWHQITWNTFRNNQSMNWSSKIWISHKLKLTKITKKLLKYCCHSKKKKKKNFEPVSHFGDKSDFLLVHKVMQKTLNKQLFWHWEFCHCCLFGLFSRITQKAEKCRF